MDVTVMSCSSCFFLKYFAVFWLAFSDAQLQPPSDGSEIVLNSGETKSITWRYNGVVPEFDFKSWTFIDVDGTKGLATMDSGGLKTFHELNIDFRIIEPFTLVLRSVNETYNGTYSLNVFSITAVAETSTVDVFIAVPPTIDVNCSDTTTLNASASFSCQCNAKNGNPPVNEVKWYKDPQVLSSGTEMAILKIERANRFDNGQYRCEAMGHEKSKAEKTIELIVNYKPVNVRLTLQREGDKATLTCTAEGNPPPRYEIFVNGSLSVMNGSTLVINEVSTKNVGDYTCRATNNLGSQLSQKVNLPLKAPPTIDVNCSDTTTLNASASFSCQCNAKNGNPPVNDVKWYKGTQVLSSGTEMAILKIERANRFDNGQYRCEAMGHEKSKAEKTIELIVNYKPVNVQLTLQREGDKATLTCTAEGNPPPRYEIFVNGSLSVMNGSTLVIKNVSTKNVGDYTCRATNILGSQLSQKVNLLLKVPPTIDVNCSDTTTLNASASFSCQCEAKNGNPPVNDVKWYKDPRVLSSGTEMAILKIEQANRFDNDQYRCEAMGHEKSKAEKTIELIVNYKPVNVRLTLQREGDKATLTCTAGGNPPPRYEIFVNGSLSVLNGSTLVINEVSTKNVGDYTCRATNILGSQLSQKVNLPLKGMSTTTPSTTDTDMKISTTSIVDCKTDWLVTSISFISGIIFGILFCCLIFLCYGRRWLVKKSQMSQSHDGRTNTVNTTYEELDLSKRDDGDKYESLRKNNDDDNQYQELNKVRDPENNYQSLNKP
ncbi:hemicentin-2-like isoform X2 [Xenia sp. Carnegie-2017]|uniref:hemicentin-2-like isoform X2 n=1 Tax=Xenia sp. Carnegie-2017 TaxID=2897299 RepID=UPI001F04B2E1|nr:hemicentin-2-like isoform X2 [Xenia sp. Carnegie-2017]